jgi:putative FmdB family regulatory protein
VRQRVLPAGLRPNDGGVGDRPALVGEDRERPVEAHEGFYVRCMPMKLVGPLEQRDLAPKIVRLALAPLPREHDGQRLRAFPQAIDRALGDDLFPGAGKATQVTSVPRGQRRNELAVSEPAHGLVGCDRRAWGLSRPGRGSKDEELHAQWPTMPTYEFHCQTCDRIFELQQSLSAYQEHIQKHDLHCPVCQSEKVEQQVTVFEVETAKKS